MKTILFICTANIARSPMAAALFDHKVSELGLADQFRAESAGTWGLDGQQAALDGQRVMFARGLDTSMHHSRVVNQEIIENADLILTMERGHAEALKVEFPAKRDKIYLLTEMIGPPCDIDDPYQRGPHRFEETAKELENILELGIDKILELANTSS